MSLKYYSGRKGITVSPEEKLKQHLPTRVFLDLDSLAAPMGKTAAELFGVLRLYDMRKS